MKFYVKLAACSLMLKYITAQIRPAALFIGHVFDIPQ
jgi:hypothetical protein